MSAQPLNYVRARPPASWADRTAPDGPSHVYIDEIAVVRRLRGEDVPVTIAERAECVRRLHARGMTDKPIARVLGLSDRTVLRIRGRLGLVAIVPSGRDQ